METRRQQRWSTLLLPLALLLIGAGSAAWGQQAAEPASYGVVVTSLGGDAEYEKLIQGWGKDLAAALRKGRNAEGHVYWLAAMKDRKSVV